MAMAMLTTKKGRWLTGLGPDLSSREMVYSKLIATTQEPSKRARTHRNQAQRGRFGNRLNGETLVFENVQLLSRREVRRPFKRPSDISRPGRQIIVEIVARSSGKTMQRLVI